IGANFRLPRGPWNFRNHIYALISISLSPGLLCSRRPPYAAGGLRPPRARGQMDPGKPLRATWPAPWHILARTRVPGCSRAATTPPAMRRATAAPPARRRLAQGQIDRPQSLHSSPRSSLAYKDPQNPTVAPFFPFFLLPPLRHGRRDPALADRLAQPHIAPSDHRNSFATSQLSSTRAESNPNPLPKPFPFCAAAG